jgi:hypothetical protein
MYVRQFVSQLLLKAFPNLTPGQVDQFVVGLFTTQKNVQDFKTHLRDFLVQLKVSTRQPQTRAMLTRSDLVDERPSHHRSLMCCSMSAGVRWCCEQ